MPKVRATITMDYDAKDLFDVSSWASQVRRLSQKLQDDGWPNVACEIKERRDRVPRKRSSEVPPFRRQVPPS